jgi:hypothetical protein
VLARLRAGPVCAYAFYEDPGITHRLAARIKDLRDMGYQIETRRCADRLHDHVGKAASYVLTD